MEGTAYLIFLDGEKHSIWSDKADADRQVHMLQAEHGRAYVTIEDLPNVNCTNGVYFL